jgi:hypothetical protein
MTGWAAIKESVQGLLELCKANYIREMEGLYVID